MLAGNLVLFGTALGFSKGFSYQDSITSRRWRVLLFAVKRTRHLVEPFYGILSSSNRVYFSVSSLVRYTLWETVTNRFHRGSLSLGGSAGRVDLHDRNSQHRRSD